MSRGWGLSRFLFLFKNWHLNVQKFLLMRRLFPNLHFNCSLKIDDPRSKERLSQDKNIMPQLYLLCYRTKKRKSFLFFLPPGFAHSSSAHLQTDCVPQNRWYVLLRVHFGAVLGDTHAELCKT